MATVVVKAHMAKNDGSVETRRFPMPKDVTMSPGLFKTVHEKIGKAFPDLEKKCFSLMWKDSDGDFVLMSSDVEIQDALKCVGDAPLHVYVQIDGDKIVEMIQLTEASKPKESRDPPKTDEKIDEDRTESQGFPPFVFHPGMMCPPPPPPPPPFPYHFGPFQWPKGDTFKGGWKHGHPHMGWGMGFHGGPMGSGPFGWKGHGGGRRDHPFGPHHHGHHHSHGHHDHHRGHHCHGDKSNGCKHGAGWKAELRNEVPHLHRCWTKLFIQKWRQENLSNATTTTSDNNSDDELTMEKAGVPEAYRKWLSCMLPSWHKKWSVQKMNDRDEESDDEKDKHKKKLIKDSVPKEFRKWTKWYLQRHFGKRQAPRFRGHGENGKRCHQDGMELTGMNEKETHGQFKKRILASLVPTNHRVWAKKFIYDWRLQKKLEDPMISAATTSESDDAGPTSDDEQVAVPEDYGKWLEIFLQKWHRWRGLIEKSEAGEEKGVMGRFKDTVPMDFRAWVKQYLSSQYGRQKHVPRPMCDQANDDEAMAKYRSWLKIFKKKWLEEHQSMDENSDGFTVLTDSDEGETPTFEASEDNSAVPEKSFKRLRLSDEEEGRPQKNVHFDPSTDEQPLIENKLQKKMMKMMKTMIENDDEPEDMDIRKGQRKHPINHRFRKWVWQELDNWDGQSEDNSATEAQTASQPGESTDIPPHVYQWMLKVMGKMQMKQMRQQKKAAKREMKASRKLAKAEMKAARRAASFQ